MVSALVFPSGRLVTNVTGNATAAQALIGQNPANEPYAITFEELVSEGLANVERFLPSPSAATRHAKKVLAINAFPTQNVGRRASDYRFLRLVTYDYTQGVYIQELNSYTITGLWFKPQICSLHGRRTRLRLFPFMPTREDLRIGLDAALMILQLEHGLYGPWAEMRMVAFQKDPYYDLGGTNDSPEIYHAFRVANTRREAWWLVGSRFQQVTEMVGSLDPATDF